MDDQGSINKALQKLADEGMHIFLCPIYGDDDVLYILTRAVAVELGIAGEGFFWVFTTETPPTFWTSTSDPALLDAFSGSGRLGSSGAKVGWGQYETMIDRVFWPGEDEHIAWYNNDHLVQAQPSFNLTPGFFSTNPPTAGVELYAYDAAIAHVFLAACSAYDP
jgi:hypothetical protein